MAQNSVAAASCRCLCHALARRGSFRIVAISPDGERFVFSPTKKRTTPASFWSADGDSFATLPDSMSSRRQRVDESD